KPDHAPAASATHPHEQGSDPRARRLGGRGPGQRTPARREGLHLRFCRPEPLVELGHHHRAWRELVLERVLQNLRFLAPRRIRRSGAVSPWRLPEERRHVLVTVPALVLKRMQGLRRSRHAVARAGERASCRSVAIACYSIATTRQSTMIIQTSAVLGFTSSSRENSNGRTPVWPGAGPALTRAQSRR